MTLIFKKMNLYRLKRSDEMDKSGRPSILLDYFGNQSLVWIGTSVMSKTTKDKPFILKLGNKHTYFYSRGIQKVESQYLKSKWNDTNSHKVKVLSLEEQKQLISKFSRMTYQLDPYEKITLLELKNEVLENQNEVLKYEKENLLNMLHQQEFER